MFVMPTSDTKPQILSTTQAARELNISPRTLLHWIGAGRVEATKTGPGTAGYVIARAELERVRDEQAVARTG